MKRHAISSLPLAHALWRACRRLGTSQSSVSGLGADRPRPALEALETRILLASSLGQGAPAAAAAAYVGKLYHDLLQRQPVTAEITGWQGAAHAGSSAQPMVQ